MHNKTTPPLSYYAIPGIPSVRLTRAEMADLKRREAAEERILAKHGPAAFELADWLDDLERVGIVL
jgi:hypothetical protein